MTLPIFPHSNGLMIRQAPVLSEGQFTKEEREKEKPPALRRQAQAMDKGQDLTAGDRAILPLPSLGDCSALGVDIMWHLVQFKTKYLPRQMVSSH